MTNYTIRTANWETDKEQLLSVRHTVFVDEQSVPIELECDGEDERAQHWLVVGFNGVAIGTARMSTEGQIGRMAISKEYRKQGVGYSLLSTILESAAQQHLMEVYLCAQVQALGFYRKLGFIEEGEQFMDAGIAHYKMRKRLIESRILGTHGGNFPVPDLHATALELISQVDRQLRILSYDLDPDVFDDSDLCELVSQLARKSRHTHIRILVVDTSRIVQNGHRLVALQQRLSSSIHLRIISGDPRDVQNNLILADELGIISQSISEKEKMWANFNNRPIVFNHITQFDELWNRAVEDKNIRPLDI